MNAFSITPKYGVPARPRRPRGRNKHWFEQKLLTWQDGYCVLLRIETRFWEAGERIPQVQAVLDSCRRAVLAELGYRVE